jgi:phospholipid/cholesterol/gamma-HCH transport system substrate-binding protein
MKMLDKKTRGDAFKLAIFLVVTTLATSVLVVLIGNISFGAKRTYKAEFADATGVVKGDDIRIAGVKVGSVKKIEIFHRTHALVTFSVEDQATVTRSSSATIRYRNLVGQRYISLTQGVGNVSRLPENATIPLSRTTPALDLTLLFNGFKPLFAALTPTDVNKLSFEIVQVFQGEGNTVEGLLGNTSAITQTLASRDKVIGELIGNLNDVLETVSSRDTQLNDLITRLRQFVGGLKDDRQAILGSLDTISNLSQQTADLVTGIRPSFAKDVKNLRQVAGNINQNRDEVNRALQVLPIKLNKIGRTAIYGSFFNFYLCNFEGRVVLPTGTSVPVDYNTGAARCHLG